VNPTRVNMVRDEASVSLQNKLESLKFETITFEDTEIETVITYLKNESKKIDPDGEGVNFVVKVSPQVKKDDIKVNLSLLNISMSDVLRYVCQTTGLQYRIQDNTVLIGTHDLEDLET